MKKQKFNLNYSFSTSKGLRSHNEDAGWVGSNKSQQCFAIICDGVGSQTDSQLASSMITDFFVKKFNKRKHINNPEHWVKKTLVSARKQITKYCKKNLNGSEITTTFCAVLVEPYGLVKCFNLGDTRAYHYSAEHFRWTQVTKDHNLYNYLVSINAPEHVFEKNKDKFLGLTKFVDSNSSHALDFDIFQFQIKNGDLIFLASDGTYNFINLFRINEIIKNNRNLSFSEFSKLIIKEALNNHSYDNLTSIIIEGFEKNDWRK